MTHGREVGKARLDAFIGEFPFILRYWDPKMYFSKMPLVQRVELDLLEQRPRTKEHARANGDYCGERRFIFIALDGSELGEVSSSYSVRAFSLFRMNPWGKQFHDGETVLEALRRLDADQVAYILQVGSARGEPPVPVIVHKVPDGMTIRSWTHKIKEFAERELRGQINKIDMV